MWNGRASYALQRNNQLRAADPAATVSGCQPLPLLLPLDLADLDLRVGTPPRPRRCAAPVVVDEVGEGNEVGHEVPRCTYQ